MAVLFMESPRALAAEACSPDKSPRPAVSPRKKAADSPSPETRGQLDETALRSLVLSPLELGSALQKRTQACVLRNLVHAFKVGILTIAMHVSMQAEPLMVDLKCGEALSQAAEQDMMKIALYSLARLALFMMHRESHLAGNPCDLWW